MCSAALAELCSVNTPLIRSHAWLSTRTPSVRQARTWPGLKAQQAEKAAGSGKGCPRASGKHDVVSENPKLRCIHGGFLTWAHSISKYRYPRACSLGVWFWWSDVDPGITGFSKNPSGDLEAVLGWDPLIIHPWPRTSFNILIGD